MARKKKKGSKLFTLCLCLLCLACVGLLAKQEYEILKIQKEQAETQKRIEVLKKQKMALEAERKNLDEPRYIEKLAREDYNMVGKNEVPIFVVEEKK